jgi:signal transduction histidine kinase
MRLPVSLITKHNVTSAEQEKLKTNYYQTLVRNEITTLGFIAVYIIFLVTTDFYSEHKTLSWLCGEIIFILVLADYIIYRYSIKKQLFNDTIANLVAIVNILLVIVFSSLTAFSVYYYGFISWNFILLLFIASGASIVYAIAFIGLYLPNLIISILLVPFPIFLSLAFLDTETILKSSGIFAFAFIYLLVQFFLIRQFHYYFWNASIQALVIEKQSRENEKVLMQVANAHRLASIGKLAVGVAHEINNPLLILLGNSEILDENYKSLNLNNQAVSNALSAQKVSINRIIKIVESLRMFSYSEVDVSALKKVSVHKVINDCIDIMNKFYNYSCCTKITLCLNATNDFFMGDEVRLSQILINILNNARDAIGCSTDGRISVSTHNNNDGDLVIFVADNGHGIKDEDKNKIFDAFFTTRETGTATGLGLSVAYTLVKSMNGNIAVESEEGKGATFYIIFPSAPRAES